jgi:5'-3' exonuclease
MRAEIVALAESLGRDIEGCIAEHLGVADGTTLTEAQLDRLEARLEAELERVAIVEEASRCVLFDGDNLFRRAFFAVPANAVRAFARSLKATLDALAPELALVIFDAGGDGGRRKLLPSYKGSRTPPPDDLVQLFAPARKAVEALGLRWVEDRRWEADDLLASYARAARRAGYSVVVVSSDKDLLQLCDDPLIETYDTKTRAFRGPAHCQEHFAVPPGLLGDLLGLAGDSTDNVPGVPGVGLKTAAALLHEHGSLENVLGAAPAMPESKRRAKLLEHADAARVCRQVVALREDVPLAVALTEIAAPGARRPCEPKGPSLAVRKVLFLPDPDPSEPWYVPVAALQRHPDGRVSVHEATRPSARSVGGAAKLALLDLQLPYVRATPAFDRLHPSLGHHFRLGQATETHHDPAAWAGLPVVVDDRQTPLPRPGRSIAPGSPLGAHGYRTAKHGPGSRSLVRRWLFAQIQGGGRALDELRSIAPGEHLGSQGEAYGSEVVRAWAYVRKHRL